MDYQLIFGVCQVDITIMATTITGNVQRETGITLLKRGLHVISPWKVFAFANDEAELLTNQLVYLLGEECKIEDTSWIKPGWVTFDWWSRRGIYGVDFKQE